MTFANLGLNDTLLTAIAGEGYETPTPIQQQSIGHIISGRDLLGVAQTGTGKTAAFALPILHRLSEQGTEATRVRGRKARVLVLSPTRELATQIATSFSTYGRNTKLRKAVIFGGVSQNPQVKAVREGVDILVATPGRLMDLMQQGLIKLDGIEMFVLDEADRMFDMGFIHDIRKIVSHLPTKRQTLLFSATMPPDIRNLAGSILNDPVHVQIAARKDTAESVEQSVYFVSKQNKPALLKYVIEQHAMTRTLVFTRTKHGADRVAKQLAKSGMQAEAIHGEKSQRAREKALSNFKVSSPAVLIATDVASRGLDIDAVSHVVNYDLPDCAETYVHRIGRTGRAGATGVAMSFCEHDQKSHLRQIEKLLRNQTLARVEHPLTGDAPKNSTGGDFPDHGAGPNRRKPHARGPEDGRQRSRRRKFGKRGSKSSAQSQGGKPFSERAHSGKQNGGPAKKKPSHQKVATGAGRD